MKPHEAAGMMPIDLWLVDGAALGAVPRDALRSVLAADEIEKAEQYYFEADAVRSSSSRYWLRLILSGHMRVAPRDIEFRYGEFGKPCVDAAFRLYFSMSHVAGMTLIALSAAPVGVDVEIISRWPIGACMHPFFQPKELEWINSMAKEKRAAYSSFVWTAKEALLKATGEGIRGIGRVGVYPFGEDIYVYSLRAGETSGADWRLLPVRLPEDYVGALAIQASASSVSYRRACDAMAWSPPAA
jgi:4'-phosphopantetheinyl transferase